MATKLTLDFKHERSTKGAHRFQETDKAGNFVTTNNGAVIGTLYVRKERFGEKAPEALKVTIEVA